MIIIIIILLYFCLKQMITLRYKTSFYNYHKKADLNREPLLYFIVINQLIYVSHYFFLFLSQKKYYNCFNL